MADGAPAAAPAPAVARASVAGAADAQRVLSPLHAFGLQNDVQNNVIAVDESTILHPVGRAIALYSVESRKMAFVREGTKDSGETIALALSPSKKYLAVCERAEMAQISIYHVSSQKRTKVLPAGGPLPDCASDRFVTAAFSSDSKLLAAVTNDCTLALWLWDKGRLLACAKNPMATSITRVSFDPRQDAQSSTICTTGPKYLRLWRLLDGSLKAAPGSSQLSKKEPPGYTDHCWLPGDDRIGACTDAAEIFLLEKGEIKHTIASAQQAGAPSLACIQAFARGFVTAGAGGMLCIFEGPKEDERVPFQLTHTFWCSAPAAPLSSSPGSSGRDFLDITALTITPSEELLVVSCANSQLASFPIANIDILPTGGPEECHFAFLSGGFHHGAVTGMDVCVQKPLLVTCGVDRTLRVWNYTTKMCEQLKTFADEPLSASLHPTGHQVLLGFSDKLRLFNLLMDDIRMVADMPVKGCRECRFALGGQFFAAVSGPHIHVFATYSAEQLCTLKGHSGVVRSISWREGDRGLASAGVDGAVYEWEWGTDGPTMERLQSSDFVLKASKHEAVLCGKRSKGVTTIHTASHDGVLRGISGGAAVSEKRTELGKLLCLAQSKSDHLVLCGSASGVVRAYELPLESAEEPFEDMLVHSAPVNQFAISHDEGFLFSASEDGALLMWEMLGEGAPQRERAMRKEGDGPPAETDTVLVSKAELLERVALSEELEQKVKEQAMQAEYQAHLREQTFQEQLRLEKLAKEEALAEAAREQDDLRRMMDVSERESAEGAQGMEAAHMKAAEELEHLYERKLAAEAARWEALRKDKEDMQCELEERIYALVVAGQEREERLKQEREEIRSAADKRLGESDEQQTQLTEKYEEMLRQEERDNDTELDAQAEAAFKNLTHEREEKQTLKGEQAIMRKKFSNFQTDMAKLKASLDEREAQIKGLRHDVSDREKVIALLKKDVQEREESIADKERRLSELKAKNKELEKFKFVLDYKLRELAKEIEPRDEQIMQMRETIRELDDELQRDYKTSVGLEHGLAERQAKIESLQGEVKKARREVLKKERALNFLGRDVQKLANLSDPAAVKEGVKLIYHSIGQQADLGGPDEDDEAVQAEFANQRAYMERALESLRTRLNRTEGQTRGDMQKKIAENETLITECNSLRRDARELKAELARTQNELQTMKHSGGGAAGGRGRPPSRGGLASSGLLRPTTAESSTSLPPRPLALSQAGAVLSQAGSAGRLLKGSAGVMGRERARTAEVLMSLEANQREMAVQRAEILRLREQVHALTSSGEGDAGAPASDQRPVSSQDRPITHSPVQQPPRATSSMD